MYNYEEEKKSLMTDKGQRAVIATRDHVLRLLKQAGAVRMHEAMQGSPLCSSWEKLACVDRLVELGDIRELQVGQVAGQHRVFVSARG